MHIGIDIGGYKIISVLLDSNRKILRKTGVLTKSKSNRKIIIAQIFDCIEYLLSGIGKKKIKGIGIGVPAPVNVTALKNVSLAQIVQRKFKIETRIDNDANCFGLAEAVLGAGKDAKVLAGLTLGTGVGGALIINGKIFHGAFGQAAELGHMIIQKDGRKCSCGNNGCLEAYVSAKGIMKIAMELECFAKNPEEITQMAKRGDKKAIEVYKKTGEYLGIGLANIVNILNPDIIVIGGGISNAGKFIFEPARKTMRDYILSPLAKNTKVVKAKLGEEAGAIGAALLSTTYPH